jgi:hypothetical protein
MVPPSLLTAVEVPKASPLAPFEAVSLAVKVDVVTQPVPGIAKTYAVPWRVRGPTVA